MYNYRKIENQERFSRAIHKLNKSTQIDARKKTAQSSFLIKQSLENSTQNSTTKISGILPASISQQQALSHLLESYEVFINRQRMIIRFQFIPTSNGMRFILVMGYNYYINLSWLHSIQHLQKGKILLLYFELQKIINNIKSAEKPNIVSKIIEFGREKQAFNFLNAVYCIHQRYHDPDAQKIYHQLTS